MTNIKSLLNQIPKPTLIIFELWVLLLILGFFFGLGIPMLLSDAIHLFVAWALFALAMVPTIKAGIGPNFALPVGMAFGQFSMITAMNMGFMGPILLIISMISAMVLGCITGYIYGKIMNAVKGSEMIISVFIGFTVVFFFCLVWLVYPIPHIPLTTAHFHSRRMMVNLGGFEMAHILDNFLMFEFFGDDDTRGLVIRTGTLLFIAAVCLLMWLFFRSKYGIAVSAAGENPEVARASGVNVDRSRIIASMISMTLAAVGLIVYSQSFGFIQIFDSPLFWAFPAAASVLFGGATMQKANIIHVLIGVVLFQGVMANLLPVFSSIPIATSEIINPVRQLIQNGVILYALIQMRSCRELSVKYKRVNNKS